jgi:hypothetical protein
MLFYMHFYLLDNLIIPSKLLLFFWYISSLNIDSCTYYPRIKLSLWTTVKDLGSEWEITKDRIDKRGQNT